MCFVFVIFVIDSDDLTSLNKRAREQWVISLSVFHHAAKMKIFYLLLFLLSVCLQLVTRGRFGVLKVPLGFVKVLQWVSPSDQQWHHKNCNHSTDV